MRGKKNLILEKDLAGPIGVFVKFSTLQDYGVDKIFFLENGNADTSQRNVVFIARGESARHTQTIAGMYWRIALYSFLRTRHHITVPRDAGLRRWLDDHLDRRHDGLVGSADNA